MTWSDVFPILTDELYDEYVRTAPKTFRREAAGWFAEQRVINRRETPHIVSVSLFWKNITMQQPEIVIRERADVMLAGARGKVLRFDPWGHYVKPLLQGAYRLHAARADVSFRVYLAADMEFLVEDLVEAGCEVRLMKSSSLRHNPGAMWRFLALGETGKLLTVVDADRAAMPEMDIERTEAMAAAGLNWWRVPVWGELNEIGNVSYRPFLGLQFGSTGGLTEVRTMMEALSWACQTGRIETMAKLPACAPHKVHGTVWPDYGFDEWFLLAAVYPRAAHDGILTFVPSDAKSRLLPLDIQYASRANERSELLHFGSPAAACCAPGGAAASASQGPVRLRADCSVVQERRNKEKAFVFETEPAQTHLCREVLTGLEKAAQTCRTPWIAGIPGGMIPSPQGAEIFTDRSVDGCDVAFCGYSWTRVSKKLESWARSQKLSLVQWRAGQPLKFPRLAGAPALWRTAFLRKLLLAWEEARKPVTLELFLLAQMQRGRVKYVEGSASGQGWVRTATL